MQNFKGDALELKFIAVAGDLIDNLSVAKDDFYSGAYSAAPLGDLIQVLNCSPLANAVNNDIFRISFKEIFDAFVTAGTFESYITVFEKIFGADVSVTFTVPAPGKLTIAIDATDVDECDLLARYIQNNAYVFYEVIDYSGNNIAVQTIKGFASQYELTQMLFEMVPGGIFTTISLTLG